MRIRDIPATRPESVQVELLDGRRAWLPRDLIEMTPGTVWVPVWLAEKLGFRQPGKRDQ